MKKPKLHKQEKSYSCAVSCLRTVLEFYGIKEDEKTLRIKSKTKFYGTHPNSIADCAKSYGFDAYVSALNLSKLLELISQDIPVIANILKYADNEFYIHSVVVYRIEKGFVYFLDPEDGERNLDIDLFESLWQRNDYTAIVIHLVRGN